MKMEMEGENTCLQAKKKGLGRNQPADISTMDFKLPELRENKSLLFIKPPGLWCLLQQPELIHIICRAVGEKKSSTGLPHVI